VTKGSVISGLGPLPPSLRLPRDFYSSGPFLPPVSLTDLVPLSMIPACSVITTRNFRYQDPTDSHRHDKSD
jgi:hypothetical protein